MLQPPPLRALFFLFPLMVLGQPHAGRFPLAGHVNPKARAANDLGRVSPSLEVPSVTLLFGLSPAQQDDLDQLLIDQRDPNSLNYHKWLTPEEYSQRFGIGDADLAAVAAWIESQGLTVKMVARARNWLVASGEAAQVEQAFQTELHQYQVDGDTYFANATDPSIPARLRSVVTGVRGLHNFRMKPALRRRMQPDYTSGGGSHYLAPGDLASIYNIAPLYQNGVDGTGQTVVIAGQTQIAVSNLQQFRTRFGMAGSDPQVILAANSTDPGVVSGDDDEAHLDLEWFGAVAPKASALYVYAMDVMQAVQYAIDQNLAPVVSTSYGSCEPETSHAELLTMRSWAKQANAQGMTWVSASGDAGAADCNDTRQPGLAVDAPASIPEVTGVGGTEFVEAGGQYWTGSGLHGATANGYIPETVWNDSAADGQPSAGGGGPSAFFPKPSWQTGPGVPSDNLRHVPDIAMAASANHDGYLVYTGGKLQIFGGTSVPAPAFAGLLTLLNQYLGANGLGNINPTLYALAQSAPAAFHDVVTGDNKVTMRCGRGAQDCSPTLVGFSAGVGFDDASGLGSVDAYQLAAAWKGGPASTASPAPASISINLVSNLSKAANSDVIQLLATVVDPTGATPSGRVVFSAGANLGSVNLTGAGGRATAVLEATGAQLAQSGGSVTATFGAVSASVSVSIQQGLAVKPAPGITALTNAASFASAFAPGALISVFGKNLAPSVQAASALPLPLTMGGVSAIIDGVPAPLIYVSPGQINLQIPYEVNARPAAVLRIDNNGQIGTRTFAVTSAAPGVFAPAGSAARGKVTTIYLTGAGALTPQAASGSTPPASTPLAAIPVPILPLKVTIGGVAASVQYAGNSPGLVGVVQVNVQVPSQTPLGVEPLTVSVGGVTSLAASLTITN